MKLSIIVPVYNASSYITRLLDSIANQYTSLDFELLLVDDCSTDNTIELIQKYPNLPELKLIMAEVNGGTAAARNIGITHATGQWIQFLDSDDWLQPGYFDIISPKLTDTNTDVFIYGLKLYTKQSITTITPTMTSDIRMIGFRNSVCNKIFKRSIITPFEQFKFEDVVWLVNLMCNDKLVVEQIDQLYYQVERRNDDSKMANINQQAWKTMANHCLTTTKDSNKYARSFILETFVGTLFNSQFKLSNRVAIGTKAVFLNIKYLPFVVRHGIRNKYQLETKEY